MWLVAVEKEEEFKALSSVFLEKDKKAYINTDTPFGSPLLIADPDQSKPYPSFLLLNRGWPGNREALIWCYKNLKVDAFISSGVVETLIDESDKEPPNLFLPLECCRSECNLDLLSGPLLYEEYHFDSRIQSELVNHLRANSSFLIETSKRIFSSTKAIKGSQLKKLLLSDLDCMGFDDFTGELSEFCQSISVAFGCLKICGKTPEAPVNFLSSVWFSLFEARAQEADQK